MEKSSLSILSVLLSGLLSACSLPTSTDENSFLYSVPVGSKLILKQEIPVKASLGRTFIQNGNVVAEHKINIYYPHCSLTTNTLLDHDRIIKPTAFEIYRVVDDVEYAQSYIQYASINFFSHSDGPTIIGHASYYYLHSTDEPDIRTLECVQWGSPEDVRYLSIKEIRATLGDIFSLELNSQSA